MKEPRKIILPESEMPESWYNIAADIPGGLDAPLNPVTGQPVGPQDLAPLFPMALIEQEVSTERHIPIPEEVRDTLLAWRPSPLIRARNLEKLLGTPAHIYYKYEGGSPAGSHKPNTAIPQAYYNKKEGITRLTTETGAGQWGSALSYAGALFGLEVKVYMVKASYEQKPYRKLMMQAWGGSVVPSPSTETAAGRKILAEHPDSLGSLGIAISEAVEEAVGRDDTHYALGSVLNHVMLHQTVIGLETKKQFAMAGEQPDVVIACHGGGSNFAGLAFPFVGDNLTKGTKYRCVAVEPASCPSLTKGVYEYDFGDVAGMTPSMRMYTLGHDFVPPGIHAGGLRYHGASPIVSKLLNLGLIEARSAQQLDCFKAAVDFARSEGFLPAPESSHAIRAAIDEALDAKVKGEKRVIVFGLSGHGHFDLTAYDQYLSGRLENYELPEKEIEASLKVVAKMQPVSVS
jgi:tryptophan synthase beta chain